ALTAALPPLSPTSFSFRSSLRLVAFDSFDNSSTSLSSDSTSFDKRLIRLSLRLLLLRMFFIRSTCAVSSSTYGACTLLNSSLSSSPQNSRAQASDVSAMIPILSVLSFHQYFVIYYDIKYGR